MERKLILRGALVGAFGGLLAFIFARIFAESQIQAAITYESGRDDAVDALRKAAGLPAEAPGPDIFSRTIQANVGIGVGMIAFGVAMGCLFAVAYAICLGRVGNIRPRVLALLVAGGGLLGIYLVPFLKYPANPPSIGNPDTIAQRGGYYLLAVACSLGFLITAVILGRRLQPRFGNWNATLLAGLTYVVAIGIVIALLPDLGHLAADVQANGVRATETPQPLRNAQGVIVYPGFPADTLFNFRLYSVLAQVILWGTVGLAFGPLAERVLGGRRAPSAAPAVPTPTTP